MQKSENIEFYRAVIFNKSFFKLIPYSIDTTAQNTNFHIKINSFKNIRKKNQLKKISSEKNDHVSDNQENDNIISDDQSADTDNIVKFPIKKKQFSTFKNFDFLIKKIPKLSLKQKKILFEKFKTLKSRKKEIFFYFDQNKLVLLFKKYIFRNGFSIIKSLLTHNLTNIKNKNKILKFHKLLFR